MILGVDGGNFKVKIAGPKGLESFHSAIGEWRKRELENEYGPEDMEWEYDGKKGFAGTLAINESEFAETMHGETKANEDAKMRILLGLYRYGVSNEYKIVVGQPKTKYNDTEKKKIKDMLIGKHTLKVNGDTRTFAITRCEVSPESAAVGLINPREGIVRVIDVGSGTVGLGSVNDKRFNDRDSDTLSFGLNTVKTKDYGAIARRIGIHALKTWDDEDYTRVVGGGASKLAEPLKEYFSNAELYRPMFGTSPAGPEFANAIAFYEIARKIYG